MNTRDRRALTLLAVWGLALAGWQGGTSLWRLRRSWKDSHHQLSSLESELRGLRKELEAEQGEFRKLQSDQSLPPDLPDDQLRLRGQDALLAAAQRTGLTEVRLRPEPGSAGPHFRTFQWTLEGEGTLPVWVDAIRAAERSEPFMRIQSIRINLPGDPWTMKPDLPVEGPGLRGQLSFRWFIPESTP